jgi:hypothetical protein
MDSLERQSSSEKYSNYAANIHENHRMEMGLPIIDQLEENWFFLLFGVDQPRTRGDPYIKGRANDPLNLILKSKER